MDRYTQEQATELAEVVFGSEYHQLVSGQNNWVFENRDRILTIPRNKRVKDYQTRVMANQLLMRYGLPVPQIIKYSGGTDETPEYLVVEKVRGEHSVLSKYTQKERDRIHSSAGEILRKIHNIKTEGFGRMSPKMEGENSTWLEFTDSFFDESIGRLMKTKDLYDIFGKKLEGEYLRGREKLERIKIGQLLHADFHMGNLLFNNGFVSAVLDLDLISSGDGNWDTGHYYHTFNFDRNRGVRSFREGYCDSFDKEIERLYCLMIWTRKIGSQAISRPHALKETIPELEKIIRGKI